MLVRRKKAQTTRAWDALVFVLLVFVALGALATYVPRSAHATEGEPKTVRVGYYENEVFEEDVATAKEAGMNGHLAKPYDIDAMMEMLDGLIPIDPANTARL